MTSAPVRDPLANHLITPQNAALLLIDYPPSQLAGVRSMDHALLVKNAVSSRRSTPARPRGLMAAVDGSGGAATRRARPRRRCWPGCRPRVLATSGGGW
jgi:hypothetical protein